MIIGPQKKRLYGVEHKYTVLQSNMPKRDDIKEE